MSTVGAFPGLGARRKRTIRAPINPMDKSTIISIFPRHIKEHKPTIQPGVFIIQPGTYDNPTTLVVGPSSWWKEIDNEQPLLEIPTSSVQIAKSIVRDYCNGMLGCNMSSSMPGLFWVPGEFTPLEFKLKHQKLMEEAKKKQDTYYLALIKLADSFWARTNGNPLCISDDMRLAARELNVHQAKDWMKDFTITTEQSKCPACGSLRNTAYPVCPTCKAVIDQGRAKELNIVFATG